MEPLPPHIRPEDAVYFQPPLPLTPMSFRAKWWLGFKLVVGAQVLWLPFSLFFGVGELLERQVPDLAASSTWANLGLLLLALSFLLGPVWAAMLFRNWVASAVGQQLLRGLVASPSEADRR